MRLVAIAIVASNRVIGDGKDQPFTFREDWARFKRVTMGHPLIMGRRTYDAIGALPGRPAIVVTRHPESVSAPGCAVGGIDEAIRAARELDDERAFVIGGGEIYRLAWEFLDELDLTCVHAPAEGTVTFPVIGSGWIEVSREERGEFDFVTLIRDA